MSDLDDEIRSHLEHEMDDNMARGMTRDRAEAAAYRKFGNRTRVKEDVWRLRPWAWLDGVRQDLRYALRMMRKNWGFTAIAVASLALGIGGNTALFSLVDRLMLRTLPVREPERLVALQVMTGGRPHGNFSYPDYAMAYTVSRRTAELGVRMALGARPTQIARIVVRETGALAALGLVIGIPLARRSQPAGGGAPVLDAALRPVGHRGGGAGDAGGIAGGGAVAGVAGGPRRSGGGAAGGVGTPSRPAGADVLGKYLWRRKRDSNPRVSFPTNGFQDRRLQPLGHSSTFTVADLTVAWQC